LFRFQGTKAYRRRNGNFTKFRPRRTSGGTSKCRLCPQERTLLTTTGLDTLAPKYAAQTKALRAELLKAGIQTNGPTIAMNAGEFEGVQPDHHGL
jgi:hypothetical protein